MQKSVSDCVESQKRRNELLRELKRQPTSQVADINAVDSVIDYDYSAKTYPKIDLSTPGLRVVNQEPPVYMVDNFLQPSECDALISAAKSEDLESIKYNGRYVLLDHQRLWPIFPMIFLSAIPKSHILSSALSWESFQQYLTVLGPNALMVGSMILLVPRIGEFLAPYVSKDSGAEAKSSKWTGLGDLTKKHPARLAHESLLSRAENLCFAQQARFEKVKVTRYLKGAGQDVHADAYAPPEPGKEKEYLAGGGQRLAQCLVYLNDVPKEDGGSTKFYHPSVNGLAVQPKKGSALVFFPAFDDATEDARMMHAGETYFGDGAKWTAGTWLHESDIPQETAER
jgi:collagen type III alpha